MAMQSAFERLNLPRDLGRPRRIEASPPAESGTARAAQRRVSRRVLLGSTGGTTPLAPPDRATRRDPVLTLVQRITYGFNLAEYEHAQSLGFEGYLEEQLDHLAIPDFENEDLIRRMYRVVGMSPKQVYDNFNEFPNDAYQLLKGATLARATSSKRQLFERMCEFWVDHFNIDHNKDVVWMLLPEHDERVIRAHALGSFPALLSATAFSGAMQLYLDNWLNVREAPQQNYARELMELHTLGVLGGYNETDVAEVSKCFTGWTLNGDADSDDWMRTVFDATQHTRGDKLVLGHVISGAPPVGRPGQPVERNDAQAVLDILVAHPSTPRFLARKLIAWFLTPTPPEELVERVVAAYGATNGDIKAMLRVILTRENLAPYSPLLAPKYRRPFHLMASVFRAMDAFVNRPYTALADLGLMGHVPFDYPQPTGYPDTFTYWGGSLQPRWAFTASYLRHGRIYRGLHSIDPLDLMARLEFQDQSDRPGLAARINERVLGQALSPHEVDALQQFIDTYPAVYDADALYDTLVLGTSLPGYQWY